MLLLLCFFIIIIIIKHNNNNNKIYPTDLINNKYNVLALMYSITLQSISITIAWIGFNYLKIMDSLWGPQGTDSRVHSFQILDTYMVINPFLNL